MMASPPEIVGGKVVGAPLVTPGPAVLIGVHSGRDGLCRSFGQRLVFRTAWTYTRQREGALDICQEVFVKAHRKLADFRGHGAFAGWLMRIAHHESLNWRRRERRHAGWEPLDAQTPEAGGPLAAAADQDAALIEADSHAELFALLDQLNPRQRLAVDLRYFEQQPYREIARSLDCSEAEARNILFRGLQKLRDRARSRRSRT